MKRTTRHHATPTPFRRKRFTVDPRRHRSDRRPRLHYHSEAHHKGHIARPRNHTPTQVSTLRRLFGSSGKHGCAVSAGEFAAFDYKIRQSPDRRYNQRRVMQTEDFHRADP